MQSSNQIVLQSAVCTPNSAFPSGRYAGVVAELSDHVVEPLFGAGDFIRRLFHVEKAGSHGCRDLVQVADLGQDFLRQMPKAVESAPVRNRPAMSQREVVIGECASGGLDVVAAASRNRPVIAQSFVLFPIRITEEQVSDVLDSVEVDAYAHAVCAAVDIGR